MYFDDFGSCITGCLIAKQKSVGALYFFFQPKIPDLLIITKDKQVSGLHKNQSIVYLYGAHYVMNYLFYGDEVQHQLC